MAGGTSFSPGDIGQREHDEAASAKRVISGLSVPAHDYVSLAQDATHDTWTFKSGGSGGTTVATVTITYTDATKATIASVAKT